MPHIQSPPRLSSKTKTELYNHYKIDPSSFFQIELLIKKELKRYINNEGTCRNELGETVVDIVLLSPEFMSLCKSATKNKKRKSNEEGGMGWISSGEGLWTIRSVDPYSLNRYHFLEVTAGTTVDESTYGYAPTIGGDVEWDRYIIDSERLGISALNSTGIYILCKFLVVFLLVYVIVSAVCRVIGAEKMIWNAPEVARLVLKFIFPQTYGFASLLPTPKQFVALGVVNGRPPVARIKNEWLRASDEELLRDRKRAQKQKSQVKVGASKSRTLKREHRTTECLIQ
ncbi:hypothetical protein NEOLI_001264 [Neolecta irregularis DAH-3]|uniref:Uncharacterized protein n=1 Tax=Neolecta irregularis (strain DAH-3) TaxID=1198029 RepID=A0A1U7LUX5_NEOID|nr:hypothetical protein NEOLI_001264 [Neolecta irregularis DAH-3]|eukprot:OLL26429.1 hypothetical protein NEOLI_001264 [Neolecta irregularis DAH-3]